MRTLIFIFFSFIICYLTKEIWLSLNPWYFKLLFLSLIITIPFYLYSLAAKIALELGWFGGILTMVFIMIVDNYLTNAISICIISKCNRFYFDFTGFIPSLQLFNLPWYSFVFSGVVGGITGAIGDRQREIKRQKEQKALWLGVYLLAGQFFGNAVPELTPIINRITPVVTTAMTAEVATKTGSMAITESSKITEKPVIKTRNVSPSITKTATESILKVKYFKFSYFKNGKTHYINIPDFTKQSVFETKLPSKLNLASDKVQFSKSTISFGKQLKSNPKSIEILKKSNREMLKRDKLYFKQNKKEILFAHDKMLEATKKNNLVEQNKWLKELRRRTQKITFIQTPKGKPFIILNEEQILAKQQKDIFNASINSQGRIFGYVWHHTEKKGILQLVQKDIHEYNRHIGGNAIWGENIR